MRRLPLFGLLALAAAPALADGATHRALVADHTNGKLTLIEFPSGKAIGHFAVEGPARLKAGEGGRIVYAIQGRQGRVEAIDTGIALKSHGDHVDVDVGPAKLLPFAFKGERPSHVNTGAGQVVVFFDGPGTAQAVPESALLAGKAKPVSQATARGHHGAAVPLKDHLAITVPHPSDPKELPVGVDILRRDGSSAARSTDCPRLHGEGRAGDIGAFGCADGLLLVTQAKGRFTLEKLPYPDSLPKERMVRNLAGSAGVRSLVGDFGPDGMVVIDPVAKGFVYVALPAKRLAFARDAVEGEKAFVVTEDGRLHRLNALTGGLEASLAVTGAYSLEGGAAAARPRVSASGGLVAVTDPAQGKVHVVEGSSLRLLASAEVPGAPFDVVVTGAPDADH